ncbi:hypothetical protein NC653_034365 [Populus alba x Populus x berolinensis]|uniref:Uncharacterized protein n=1 Tax=Populus alba x Populus x berolinensis TaxID=444605 RepID=A0AAD6LMC4_9ROSI|nr:hypothetical protein NC653_034365 [Populus alba x Populus x berolinensis]
MRIIIDIELQGRPLQGDLLYHLSVKISLYDGGNSEHDYQTLECRGDGGNFFEFLHDGGIPMSECVLSHFKFQFDQVRDGDIAISLQSTQCMLGCETSSCYMSMFSLGNVHGHRRLVQCGNQVSLPLSRLLKGTLGTFTLQGGFSSISC